MASYSEETPVPALSYLTFNETVDLFEKHAEQVGAFAAYQSFNSTPMRESLRIHPDIWKQLGPEIQEKISKMKADLYAKRSAAAQATPPPAEKGSNPAFKGSIPSQYPSMKKANKVDTVEMERQAMAALCEKLGELTSMDTEGDTDDEELHRNAFTTMTRFSEEESEEESEEPILIRANTQIAIDDAKHYAISDSGADSSILGKYTHVTAYTGRYAYLVGYDPNTTRSSKIPIVSGYIKVKAHNDIPIILEVHEAPYNAKSPITLISEYQARDYGTIIDSVSTRHKTIAGTYGTQRMIISPDLHVPLVDRGGLMGFEVLPWEDGDEEHFEIHTITSDAKWTPRRYSKPLGDPSIFHAASDVAPAATARKVTFDIPGSQSPSDCDSNSSKIQDHKVKTQDSEFPKEDSKNYTVEGLEDYTNATLATGDQVLHLSVPLDDSSMDLYPFGVFHESETPFSFDPSDAILETHGHTVKHHLQVPKLDETQHSTAFLSHLSYQELTGYHNYDGFQDGYRPPTNDLDAAAHLANLTLSDDAFDTRLFAVASWHHVVHKQLDPVQLRPFLGYAPTEVVKRTLQRTTQMAKMIIRAPLRRHIKSRLSFMRAKRLEETVSTDPMFANCRSLGHGYIGAQVFYGLQSHQIDVYGFRRKGEFPQIYRDFIREQGAPSALQRDNAKEEQSAAVD